MARKKTTTREKLVASGDDKDKFTVLIDSAEQTPRKFIKTDYCNGSTTANLIWGDYSIEGLEDRFTIERKASAAEWHTNICSKDFDRFKKELEALCNYDNPFIVLEFSWNDILKFPWNTKLPMSVKRKIGNRSGYLLRRTLEIMTEYPIPIIVAGSEENARTIMISLFKRIWAKYN